MPVSEADSVRTQHRELQKENRGLLLGVFLDVIPMCLALLYVAWSVPFRVAFLQHFSFGACPVRRSLGRRESGAERGSRARSTERRGARRVCREMWRAPCSPHVPSARRPQVRDLVVSGLRDGFLLRPSVDHRRPEHLRVFAARAAGSPAEPRPAGEAHGLDAGARVPRTAHETRRVLRADEGPSPLFARARVRGAVVSPSLAQERRTLKMFFYNVIATFPLEVVGRSTGMRRASRVRRVASRVVADDGGASDARGVPPVGPCRSSRRTGWCGCSTRPASRRRAAWRRCCCAVREISCNSRGVWTQPRDEGIIPRPWCKVCVCVAAPVCCWALTS